jgi:hypothetical protein
VPQRLARGASRFASIKNRRRDDIDPLCRSGDSFDAHVAVRALCQHSATGQHGCNKFRIKARANLPFPRLRRDEPTPLFSRSRSPAGPVLSRLQVGIVKIIEPRLAVRFNETAHRRDGTRRFIWFDSAASFNPLRKRQAAAAVASPSRQPVKPNCVAYSPAAAITPSRCAARSICPVAPLGTCSDTNERTNARRSSPETSSSTSRLTKAGPVVPNADAAASLHALASVAVWPWSVKDAVSTLRGNIEHADKLTGARTLASTILQ